MFANTKLAIMAIFSVLSKNSNRVNIPYPSKVNFTQTIIIIDLTLITVRNEAAKVIFSQACACPQGGGSASVHDGMLSPQIRHPPGADTPQDQTPPPGSDTPWDQTPPRSRHPVPPGADPLPPRDGYCCGRCTSCWNAFLFIYILDRKRRRFYWVHNESNLLFTLKRQRSKKNRLRFRFCSRTNEPLNSEAKKI